jgi:hypothetical protein
MKKLVGVVAVVVLMLIVAGLAFAAQQYGAAGCGLGSLLLGDQKGIVQIFAATTNGTAGNQTFGITSGTSNCQKKAVFSSNEKLNQFVSANLDSLAKDVAKGQGESLNTIAEIMNIHAYDRQVLFARLQANFSKIFPSEKVEAADVIDSIVMIVNG